MPLPRQLLVLLATNLSFLAAIDFEAGRSSTHHNCLPSGSYQRSTTVRINCPDDQQVIHIQNFVIGWRRRCDQSLASVCRSRQPLAYNSMPCQGHLGSCGFELSQWPIYCPGMNSISITFACIAESQIQPICPESGKINGHFTRTPAYFSTPNYFVKNGKYNPLSSCNCTIQPLSWSSVTLELLSLELQGSNGHCSDWITFGSTGKLCETLSDLPIERHLVSNNITESIDIIFHSDDVIEQRGVLFIIKSSGEYNVICQSTILMDNSQSTPANHEQTEKVKTERTNSDHSKGKSSSKVGAGLGVTSVLIILAVIAVVVYFKRPDFRQRCSTTWSRISKRFQRRENADVTTSHTGSQSNGGLANAVYFDNSAWLGPKRQTAGTSDTMQTYETYMQPVTTKNLHHSSPEETDEYLSIDLDLSSKDSHVYEQLSAKRP